jgi:hypothetical protein
MVVVERMIQQICSGKWAELEELTKKYDALESRFGFPLPKRYRCIVGGHNMNTLIIERQWDSIAAMEAAYEKIMADPEHQALGAETVSIVASGQIELYAPLS